MTKSLVMFLILFMIRVTRGYEDRGHVYDRVSPLHCVGGVVGGHSPLPFCTPVLYSKLTPPSHHAQGGWVRY